jgi:hypothetical protein
MPANKNSAAIDLSNTARRHALKGPILLVEDDDEVAALVTLADESAIDLVFSYEMQSLYSALRSALASR